MKIYITNQYQARRKHSGHGHEDGADFPLPTSISHVPAVHFQHLDTDVLKLQGDYFVLSVLSLLFPGSVWEAQLAAITFPACHAEVQ